MTTRRPQVTGIGGIFVYANDAEALARWYEEHLGIETVRGDDGNNYYAEFVSLDEIEPSRMLTTTFAILQAQDQLPSPRREVRISYRVADLSVVLAHLQRRKVSVQRTDDNDFGRFAWIFDPEGNELELWEP